MRNISREFSKMKKIEGKSFFFKVSVVMQTRGFKIAVS